MCKPKIIGSITDTGDIEKAATDQGFVYHNPYVFEDKSSTDICYVPELMEEGGYTRQDFINIAHGDVSLATKLFYGVDWQHPETLMEALEAAE